MDVQRDLIITGAYIVLFLAFLFFMKKKQWSKPWRKLGLFSIIFLLLYLVLLEFFNRSFYLAIPLVFFGFFYFVYQRDKPRLINGWLFNLFVVVFLTYLAGISFVGKSFLTLGILGVIGVISLLILAFGIYGLIIFLIGNSYIVMKKESHSIANLLTLLLALAIIAWLIVQRVGTHILPDWSLVLLSLPTTIMFYFLVVFWNFLAISLIYQLNHPKLQQNFVIVLGAGLIDGERVSPLLAKRIDRAISFYRQQDFKTQKPPKLLMSGGKGSDEKISEAEAMRNYALTQDIPAEDILMESASTTTLENMRFSKKLMDDLSPAGYKVIFTSNNYHIFRGGMFAHQVGLKADGIGAKTAGYYLPNAFLREFAAIIIMHKKRHFITCLLITLLFVSLALLNYFIPIG